MRALRLVVHARTKLDGYAPPAHWHWIARIREAVGARLPVVANGEIWTVDEALRCRAVSGCQALMLGRGMVTDPGLARAIRAADAGAPPNAEGQGSVAWHTLLPLVGDFWHMVHTRLEPRAQAGRLKQWLNFLRRRYPEAEAAYMALRTVNDPKVVAAWVANNVPARTST